MNSLTNYVESGLESRAFLKRGHHRPTPQTAMCKYLCARVRACLRSCVRVCKRVLLRTCRAYVHTLRVCVLPCVCVRRCVRVVVRAACVGLCVHRGLYYVTLALYPLRGIRRIRIRIRKVFIRSSQKVDTK